MIMAAQQQPSRYTAYADPNYGRIVRLRDYFTKEDVEKLEGRMRKFEKEDDEPIVLLIDSNGGDRVPATHLRQVIKGLSVPVYGLVIGRCYSAAFYVLQACHKRIAREGTNLLFHNNFLDVVVRVDPDSDLCVAHGMLEATRKHLRRVRTQILTEIQSDLQEFSRRKLLEVMKKGEKISASEALEDGFLDEVLPL